MRCLYSSHIIIDLKQIRFTVWFVICALTTISLCGQSIRTDFGKNRIQYHDDFTKWWEYETQNFIVYWYGKGRNIAQSAIQMAEVVHGEIQDIAEHRINDKIEIIVYTDISDLLQSNIGSEDTFETTHDETKVIGSRIFVYFDGNHKNLEQDLKTGIAQVYINSMYAPNGLQSIIESDPDLNVPTWYREGLVSYAGSRWNPYIEDELRDVWSQKISRFRKFNYLSQEFPRLAGHSMWYYISERYGQTSITTLLYLMRLRNDFNENVEFVYGINEKTLHREWQTYFTLLYDEEGFIPLPEDDIIDEKRRQFWPKTTLELSPDGQTLAYVVNEIGKAQIRLRDLSSGDEKVIMKYGSKNAVQETDYNYPLITWHPTRPELTVAYEWRDKITLRKIDLTSDEYIEQTIPENLQRAYSIDYISDEEYLMSGLDNGYSDLYTYHTRYRRLTAITEDYHDDIDASYVNIGGQWGALFSSNRTQAQLLNERLDTILPTTSFDVFFLPLESDFALRLTNTPEIDELQPVLANDHYLVYLSDDSGVRNRWTLDLNSRRPPYRNSNYDRNIINHTASVNSDQYVYHAYNDQEYRFYISKPAWATSFRSAPISIEEQEELDKEEKFELAPNQLLQTRYDDPEVLEPLETNLDFRIVKRNYQVNDATRVDKVPQFIPARAVASRRQFKLEDIITRVDNEVLFDGLETTAVNNEIEAQQAGFLIKAVAKDIFEDFEVSAGVRIASDFRGTEFFATVDDNRKRLDHRYAIYRKQSSEDVMNERLREQILVGLYRASYPLDTYTSLRGIATVRIDETHFLNQNPIAVELGQTNEQRIALKGEFVYDNTIEIDLNLRQGTRYKAYVQAINRFDLSLSNGLDLDFSRAFTTVIGFDARHYVPFLGNSILALRSSGATSFGSERILYFVGGVDGWITPTFSEDVPVRQDQAFAFQTIAPNLRGFDHNIRNGQSYLLGSAEARIPIFKYFSRSELKSRFLRNVQVTAFFDIGSAWYGLSPTSELNDIINTTTITGPNISVQVDLDRSPFVYGYGFGARLLLLGHFIRADYSWGVDSGIVQNPRFTLSLGTEF